MSLEELWFQTSNMNTQRSGGGFGAAMPYPGSATG